MKDVTVLSHKQHRLIDKDHRTAAKMANLTYLTDSKEGIKRVKKGKSYSFSYRGKAIRGKDEIARIKKLAIPPSWSQVWISPTPSGHIQATGIDLNGRKQYRYHEKWHQLRNETKFHRMWEFGQSLPRLRKKLKKDVASKEMTAEKVLAAAIQLMEQTYIRIGNNGYEKLYGSYGVTTLKDKHVEFKKDQAHLSFTGKKGIEHKITLKNKQLARILKQCRDIPGKELFQFYGRDGNRKTIDSGMVNSYIKEAADGDFSAKDFRTWAGSLHALECFKGMEKPDSAPVIQKNILKALDEVSVKLGNSRNICKKYYVHPGLLKLYEEEKLLPYLGNGMPATKSGQSGLSACEKILMKVLKKCG
ncbi:MAG: DNA topoisomerase IB [Chitinophagaceae bacterium]|nr:DNA topoisomerase IB [Chitinophagaceae bacterium]